MPDRSSMAAISTNIGTETNTKDDTKLYTRLVIKGTELGPNQPTAKTKATSRVTMASGAPVKSSATSRANISNVPQPIPSALRFSPRSIRSNIVVPLWRFAATCVIESEDEKLDAHDNEHAEQEYFQNCGRG